jgi:hypothetical protein
MQQRMFLTNDTVVDKLAKVLAPDNEVNWHSHRPYARQILEDIGLGVHAQEPDREITHAELAAYKAAMPKMIPSW